MAYIGDLCGTHLGCESGRFKQIYLTVLICIYQVVCITEVLHCHSTSSMALSCPLSLQGRQYFYTDYIGESLDTQTLWSNPELRDIITIHPIKDPSHVYSLHLFYRTLDYEELFFKKQSVERSLSSLCEALPNDLVPPSFLEEDCVVPFGSSHLYDKYSKPVKRTHKHHQKKRF